MVEKKRVLIYIDKNVDKSFREFIQNKYNFYIRGLLSHEIELAMKNWMALHKGRTCIHEIDHPRVSELAPLQAPNPQFKVHEAFVQVKEYLLSKYYPEIKMGQQIHLKHLEEAIAMVRGSDRRTIRKWLKLFHKFKLVKPLGGMVWEVI